MNEVKTEAQLIASNSKGDAFEFGQSDALGENAGADSAPERIQVSCIRPSEELFPPPRTFSFSPSSRGSLETYENIAHYADDLIVTQYADDFSVRSVRYARRAGYSIILASVLLLVLDGICRAFFA